METLPLAGHHHRGRGRGGIIFRVDLYRFGVPTTITSDRGSQFTSNIWTHGSSWVSGQPRERTPTSLQHRLWVAHHWCCQTSINNEQTTNEFILQIDQILKNYHNTAGDRELQEDLPQELWTAEPVWVRRWGHMPPLTPLYHGPFLRHPSASASPSSIHHRRRQLSLEPFFRARLPGFLHSQRKHHHAATRNATALQGATPSLSLVATKKLGLALWAPPAECRSCLCPFAARVQRGMTDSCTLCANQLLYKPVTVQILYVFVYVTCQPVQFNKFSLSLSVVVTTS
jgi:hypothetical protein